MKRHPIHQNLSTSFVNVAALVSHLRGLQFVGAVRIELANYEAEIHFLPTRRLRARELDQITGRRSSGKAALERILVRAREPFGRIHVYAAESEAGDAKIFIDEAVLKSAKTSLAGRGDSPARTYRAADRDVSVSGEYALLLDLIGELLSEIDKTLSAAGLDFSAAFRNACMIAGDGYPFLLPGGAFDYRSGTIAVSAFVEPEHLVRGVAAALRVILERLSGEPRFAKSHISTRRTLAELNERRKTIYSRFLIDIEIGRLLRLY